MMDDKERRIVAECAYKISAHIHVVEMQDGASYDPDLLFVRAKRIANDIIKLSGSPSAGEAGGTRPRAGVSTPQLDSPAPSCPRCNEPMEFNKNWTGLGNQPGHKKSESIKWRCSQRGRYIKDQGWSGCDGVKWQDVEGAA